MEGEPEREHGRSSSLESYMKTARGRREILEEEEQEVVKCSGWKRKERRYKLLRAATHIAHASGNPSGGFDGLMKTRHVGVQSDALIVKDFRSTRNRNR